MNLIKNDKDKIYSFYDKCNFNIGIEDYNDELIYIIKEGTKFNEKIQKKIKIGYDNELRVYEGDGEDLNKNVLIGRIKLDDMINDRINQKDNNFRELDLEFEINNKLELIIKFQNE